MSKRINEKFLKVFSELDRLCCEKFGVSTGGVTEYITRLNNARYAPDREQTLPRLVRYRNIRNIKCINYKLKSKRKKTEKEE